MEIEGVGGEFTNENTKAQRSCSTKIAEPMGAKSPDRSPATVQHVNLELDSVINGLTVAERPRRSA